MGRYSKREDKDDVKGASVGTYEVHYQFSLGAPIRSVKDVSLKTLLTRYVDIIWEPGSHKYNVTAFVLELDEILLGCEFNVFTDEMIDRLVGALRKRGNSNATINRKMAALSKLLRKAYKMGDIHSLPEFKRQKEKAGRIRFLEPDEEARLFEAISLRNKLYARFCIFLVDTGARLGEGIGLRWADIQNRRVTFWITKGGRSRSVPLTSRALAAIKASDKTKRGPFVDIDQQHFRAEWNRAKEVVGLGGDSDVVPHVLRHTCASRLVQGGVDLRRVQTWLGHQTLQMTMRYAHLASHDLDMCVPILERAAEPRPSHDAPDDGD
ncbi:site-specific integrase [Sinorhizobium sp. RAC02]|uniref:tyrosine-type recombinase/integrase n=1 Tax=Sinorhizobium sp. RAC02 TaxID=1842534 RepID=UPI00083E0ED5|nr:site-specific integrase [Sinorhizobium sp. RAC02]AOF90820.1 phage integrase family protein [Sinorhizobium sp. RAC02]